MEGEASYEYEDDENYSYSQQGTTDYYEGEEEDYGGGGGGEPVLKKKPEGLTRAECQEQMQRLAKEAAGKIYSTTQKAMLLLRHYGWDMSKATALYNDDPDRNGKLAGVGNYEDDGSLVFGTGDDDIECGACWDDFPPSQAARLGACDHWFCVPCWKRALLYKLDNKGLECVVATCLSAKCPMKCSMKVYAQILNFGGDDAALETNPQWQRYLRFQLDDYIVSQAEQFVFCPAEERCNFIMYHPRGKELASPDAIYPPGGEAKLDKEKRRLKPTKDPLRMSADTQVKCNCNFEFCYICKREAHLPVTCVMMADWKKRGEGTGEKNASESDKFILQNCKDCPNPKCNLPTEKNGGCNWMKCFKCGHEWCWMCRKPHDHNLSTHKCKMEGEEEYQKKREDEMNKGHRYVFYLERCENHRHSKKLDAKVCAKVSVRIRKEITKTQKSLSEMDYLHETATVLMEARHALQQSYIFAYYSEAETSAGFIYEDNQTQLEAATELLSQIIEDDSGKFTKAEVLNRTSTCKKMLKSFLEDN